MKLYWIERGAGMKKHKVSKLGLKYMASTLFPALFVLVVASVVCYSVVSQNRISMINQGVQEQAAAKNSEVNEAIDNVAGMIGFEDGYDVMYNYMVNYDSRQKIYFQTKAVKLMNDYAAFDKSIITSSWISIFDKHYFQSDEYCNYVNNSVTDFSEYAWYDVNMLNVGEIYKSKAYVTDINGSEDNDRVISVVSPVFDRKTNVLIGAYGIDISMRYINKLYVLEGYDTAIVFILDQSGELLYFSDGVTSERYEYAEKFISDTDITKRKEVTFRDKKYRLVTVRAVDKDWNIVYMIDRDKVAGSVNKIALPLLVTFLIAAVILTVVMTIFIVRFVERVRLVTKSTRDIADGKYDNRMTVDSDDEFGELALAFNETIDTLKHIAEYDDTTKVYNISTFYNMAERLIKSNADPARKYAIVRLDIDHFRIINDLYNWHVGNNILLHIADCINRYLPEDSICGRLSGDIFVMCIKHTDKCELESVLLNIKEDIVKYDIMVELNPHFGIYLEAEKDIPVYLMCDRAGVALSVIKGNLLNTFSYYDNAIGRKNTDIKFIETNMHSAIGQNQFFILLQPKCDMVTGRVVGAEALVRWEHPEKGLIRPDMFVPIFEKNGFIISLDEFVWEETCKHISKWIKSGLKPVPVSVNVSRVHIYDKHFVEKVVNLVKKYNIPPELLELEFTESALLDDIDELYHLMERLKENHFVLLMDDFASGYSSLNTLKSAPFDIVKLDKEFISEICNSERDRLLVSGTVSLINSQNMDIVVEGVETKEQVEALKEAGCRVAQGYYYSRPVNVAAFDKLAFD